MKVTLLFVASLICISVLSQNIGIGTTNPVFKLDVRNGSINVDSVYRIGTITVLSVPGTSNLFVGKEAGRINIGINNTFSGDRAGYNNTTGLYNSFFGMEAGYANTTGDYNSFFGRSAGYANTTGSYNSFVGQASGFANTTSNFNSFFGRFSGFSNTNGTQNTAVGYLANFSTGALTNATAIGANARVDCNNCVVLGSVNGINGASASVNVGIGTNNPVFKLDVRNGSINADSVYRIGTLTVLAVPGTGNLFVGKDAGRINTVSNNTFSGDQAGYSNTTGFSNSFFGRSAGYYNTIGYDNSFFGQGVGLNNSSGYFNSFFGQSAGYSNTTGSNNSFFGRSAGYYNTTGIDNSFFGLYAGFSNTTGDSNSFFGQTAGYLNTTGIYNSFFGQSAGHLNTTGGGNSFFGCTAGYSHTFGAFNSFFGYEAGYSNTYGVYNSFFGSEAGYSNTEGQQNSFFGRNAGSNNTTGDYNTAMGYNADVSYLSNLTNSTVIGYKAIVDANDKVRIGNTSVISIGGQVGWSNFSDGRFKYQIQEDVQGLAFIKKLRTVSYLVDLTALNNYYSAGKAEIDTGSSFQEHTNSQFPELNRQTGFIAQEVELAAKELGFSFSGVDKPTNEKALYGLRYGDFVVPLVKAVQEQQLIIETLQKQVEAAKAEIPMQLGKQQEMIEQQNTIIGQQNKIVAEQNKKIEMLINEITLIKEKLR